MVVVGFWGSFKKGSLNKETKGYYRSLGQASSIIGTGSLNPSKRYKGSTA